MVQNGPWEMPFWREGVAMKTEWDTYKWSNDHDPADPIISQFFLRLIAYEMEAHVWSSNKTTAYDRILNPIFHYEEILHNKIFGIICLGRFH